MSSRCLQLKLILVAVIATAQTPTQTKSVEQQIKDGNYIRWASSAALITGGHGNVAMCSRCVIVSSDRDKLAVSRVIVEKSQPLPNLIQVLIENLDFVDPRTHALVVEVASRYGCPVTTAIEIQEGLEETVVYCTGSVMHVNIGPRPVKP